MRREIIDRDGNKVPHLFRDKNGAILVNNPSLLNKFVAEQNTQKKILTLENELQEVKRLLQMLIESNNK